jgi:hypothetical protein
VTLLLAGAVVLAGCASSGPVPPATRAASSTTSTRAAAPAPPRPQLVAVTGAGVLEVLNPLTGTQMRTLASGATGDQVALSPRRSTVYFEVARGCARQIESVPLAGGGTTLVAVGTNPALSPDGRFLAYARQPDLTTPGCLPAGSNPAGQEAAVVRRLSNASEITYPMAPAAVESGLPAPITHLSWAPDSRRLLVSVGAAQDNEGWRAVVFDTATANYYVGAGARVVPVRGVDPAESYYRQAVFQPDGDLFVNRVCCSGVPVRITSSLLLTVAPATGATVRQVAIGYTNVDHSSLDVDASGHWLLYLAGAQLFVSDDGARPIALASGLVAAGW